MVEIKKLFTLQTFYLFLDILLKTSGKLLYVRFKVRNGPSTQLKPLQCTSFLHGADDEISNQTLVFHLEGGLLKSCSVFPYFMLVAFEAGGIFRALILFLSYPLVLMAGKEVGLRIMVFVSFVGIKKDKFRAGTSILPKFFLEDVGCEGFDMVMGYKRKVAVTRMPKIMVEGFLRDYLGIDAVYGRKLREIRGFFSGLMQENMDTGLVMNEHVGLGCFTQDHDQKMFSSCKEIYFVTEAEKKNWQILPRKKYPKPLIFHDGRLAFRPTPLATLATFIWLPLGLLLNIIRCIVFKSLPLKLSSPLLAFLGVMATISKPKPTIHSTFAEEKPGGVLYVCNHRTLLDPVYLTVALEKSVCAVTYSISRFSEVFSPIKTVRLTRDREKDGKMMKRLLSKGDLVVCPEGTTCREQYLLRFSPLFAEMTDEIVPVAIKVHVSMFYGSTASGYKCLDSTFHLMNPNPMYSVKILDKLPSWETHNNGGKSSFEVANHVQNQIAKALGFEVTDLTRKDKYAILAGTEGIL